MKFSNLYLKVVLCHEKNYTLVCSEKYTLVVKSLKISLLSVSLKHGAKFGIEAASSSELSDERALAKLTLNFRKISISPIFYGTLSGRAGLELDDFF